MFYNEQQASEGTSKIPTDLLNTKDYFVKTKSYQFAVSISNHEWRIVRGSPNCILNAKTANFRMMINRKTYKYLSQHYRLQLY